MNNNMEIYKPIKDFEDYEISNYGNVKSLKRNIILKPYISSGYYKVGLQKNGKRYLKRVHRLVAEVFLPNPDNLPQVNHRDENKLNNFIWVNEDGSVDIEKSNLEWCTVKYNINYGTARERAAAKMKGHKVSEETRRKLSAKAKGRKASKETKRKLSESHINNPKQSKHVVAVDEDNNVVYEFVSIREAERSGFNSCAISQCCRNMLGYKTHKGLRWYFKDEWLAMQKQIASPHRREDAIQLELNLVL